MARKLRLEFAGACYHALNRGNYRRDLFSESGAPEAFQTCLFESCERFGWLLHAFVIMRNHFHLALETPEPNLSVGMKWLQGTWATRFNRYRGEIGRPFQGRFKAFHVEPGHTLAQVAHYVHLNPVRAGVVDVEALLNYRWSSLPLFENGPRPAFLVASTVLEQSGGLADTQTGWRCYRAYLKVLAADPNYGDEQLSRMSCGWAIGSSDFRDELNERLKQLAGTARRLDLLGADCEGHLQARAVSWEDKLRTLAQAFQVGLEALPPQKSAFEKVQLAAAMKCATSVSNRWLAVRLQMGSPNSIAPLLHRFRQQGETRKPAFEAALSRLST